MIPVIQAGSFRNILLPITGEDRNDKTKSKRAAQLQPSFLVCFLHVSKDPVGIGFVKGIDGDYQKVSVLDQIEVIFPQHSTVFSQKEK